MRARIVAGLLGLGVALGALLGLYFPGESQAVYESPLVEGYVRVVGELYAKGESLSTVESRLEVISPDNVDTVLRQLAARRGVTVRGGRDDLAAMLAAIARDPRSDSAVEPILAASGRGSDPTPPPEIAGVATSDPGAAGSFPTAGKVSSTKGDASLRTNPALSAPVVRVIPRGSEVVILGIEHGQAVEGADDRWYQVRHADASGYVYYTLLEPVR